MTYIILVLYQTSSLDRCAQRAFMTTYLLIFNIYTLYYLFISAVVIILYFLCLVIKQELLKYGCLI